MWLRCQATGCGFLTTQQERLSRHLLFHGQRKDRALLCPDCGSKFFSLQKCLSHDRKQHTGVREWECTKCRAEVTDIKVHMKVHSTEKAFSCPECGTGFRHKNSLVRHRWQHQESRPQKCPLCSRQFVAASRLKSHLRAAHTQEAQQYEQEQCFFIMEVLQIGGPVEV